MAGSGACADWAPAIFIDTTPTTARIPSAMPRFMQSPSCALSSSRVIIRAVPRTASLTSVDSFFQPLPYNGEPFRFTAAHRYTGMDRVPTVEMFPSRSHAQALLQVSTALNEGATGVLVTGAPGIGKTTLCRALAAGTDERTFAASVVDPAHDV